MTLRLNSRLLNGVNSSSPSSSALSAPDINRIDSDFVVILAALLCALICVLGLVAVARCAWIRRIANASALSTTTAQPPPPANKGLKKKALNSLPKLTYSPPGPGCGKFSVDCAICLAEFVAGDEIRLLPQCGHAFHAGCVDAWLKSHSSCPSCRVQILAVATDTDTSSARRQKCGEFPPASSSSVAVAAAADTGTTTTTSVTMPSRQDEINVFLH